MKFFKRKKIISIDSVWDVRPNQVFTVRQPIFGETPKFMITEIVLDLDYGRRTIRIKAEEI